MRGLTARLGLAAVAAALVPAGLVGLAAAPSYAAAEPCQQVQADTATGAATAIGAPLASLGIPRFQADIRALGVGEPGAGVGVAVVDSGIKTGAAPASGAPGLAKPAHRFHFDESPYATYQTAVFYHGTAVAGLIAGRPLDADGALPVGVAPGAHLVDDHFYESDNAGEVSAPAEDKKAAVSPDTLVHALKALGPLVGPLDLRVVNVSVAVGPSRALERVVTALTGRGVVVVAASGNRPTAEGAFPSSFATPRDGEDAVDTVFPAGYAVHNPLVVAVGSTVEGADAADPKADVLPNSAITVVAPSLGGVSYGLNGQSCTLPDVATSWSTAEVSGVIAALMSALPDETSQQIVSRLEATATGSLPAAGVPNDPYTGRGVIQPLEALHRPLRFDAHGFVVASRPPKDVVRPAILPTPAPDVLESTRHHALWWGLAGGGALVVAVTLRPVLARRRRPLPSR